MGWDGINRDVGGGRGGEVKRGERGGDEMSCFT